MDKRILVLLGICSFLAVTTLTIRYIEVEKKKIKAKFPNLPKEKKIKIRRNTTSVFLPPEEPVIEDKIPVKAIERKDVYLQKEKFIQEKKIAPPRNRTEMKTTVPKSVIRAKKKKEVFTDEVKDTPEKEDVVTPLDEEKNLEEEETISADEEETTPAAKEKTDIQKEHSDDEVGEEVAGSEDDRVIPEEESEWIEIDDEEWVPEDEEEIEESGEIVPGEEGIVDQEEELLEEGEGGFLEQEEIFLEEE